MYLYDHKYVRKLFKSFIVSKSINERLVNILTFTMKIYPSNHNDYFDFTTTKVNHMFHIENDLFRH